MIFHRLTKDYVIRDFDCYDQDLNDFLINDAWNHSKELLTVTYIIKDNDDNRIIGFFSLSNDRVSIENIEHKNRFLRKLPNPKRTYKYYPSVKIARLGINAEFQKLGFGTKILDFIKIWFVDNNKTGCRYITVDAYNKTNPVKFYQKNGFIFLTSDDENKLTRSMYYDLIEIYKLIDKNQL